MVPLLDAREGLKEIGAEDVVDDAILDIEVQPDGLIEKELEKAKNNEKFQSLIKKHEAASGGKDICIPPLYVYTVPEDKNAEDYEDSKKRRLAELEGICKSGPSNLCRASSVWKGNKEKEDQDRKWAEDKLKLLRSERNALKDGSPVEAKKYNFKMKLHDKTRPVPDSKRKELEKSGSSPNQHKILKTSNSSNSGDSKLPLAVGNQS